MGEQFFQLRAQGVENLQFDNVTFLLNAVDDLAGDQSFIELRKRRRRHRTLGTVESLTKTYEEQRLEGTREAEENAEEQLEAAQKRLDDAVAALQERTDLDLQTKRIMIANQQKIENRRLTVARKNVEDEKQRRIERSRSDMEASIRNIQNSIKIAAVALSPVPAFLLFLFVSVKRIRREESHLSRERDGVNSGGFLRFATWRLKETLPKSIVETWDPEDPRKPFVRLDDWLDKATKGPEWLRQPIAQISVHQGERLEHYRLDAWVVMSNHVHILIEPNKPLSEITRAIKVLTARRANQILDRTGQPFESDPSITDQRPSQAKNRRYIEYNPVKAGLVARPEDYRWSSGSGAPACNSRPQGDPTTSARTPRRDLGRNQAMNDLKKTLLFCLGAVALTWSSTRARAGHLLRPRIVLPEVH